MKKIFVILCVATALVGCQTAKTVDALPKHPLIKKVVQQQNKIIAYFDSHWKLIKEPTEDGFYRKLYGKTAKGHYIAQDFYQKSKTKQVDPFEIINEEGLTVGHNNNNTGTIVWYTPEGKKSQEALFDNGRNTGNMTAYHPSGAVAMRIRPLNQIKLKQMSQKKSYAAEIFAPNGNKNAYIVWQGNRPVHLELYKEGKNVFSIKKAAVSSQKNKQSKNVTRWISEGDASEANRIRAMLLVDAVRVWMPND